MSPGGVRRADVSRVGTEAAWSLLSQPHKGAPFPISAPHRWLRPSQACADSSEGVMYPTSGVRGFGLL